MINIRNFGSKVGVGVKYKHGIYAELCLKLWLESDWYFCDITVRMVLKVTVEK